MAVDSGVDEARRYASQRDAFALAELAIDDDARHPLHRFGEVLVWQFVDVLRSDRVDDRIGLAFDLHGFAQGLRCS